MASMFGHFVGVAAVIEGSPEGAPGVGEGGPGGFPGIFPAAGVSNSGWAGFNQQAVSCTPDDIKAGRCVMGPPPQLMGRRPGSGPRVLPRG